MTASRLGRSKDQTVGCFDPSGAERHPTSFEIHVVSPQPEQLRSTGTRHRRKCQEQMELNVAVGDKGEQRAQFVRC